MHKSFSFHFCLLAAFVFLFSFSLDAQRETRFKILSGLQNSFCFSQKNPFYKADQPQFFYEKSNSGFLGLGVQFGKKEQLFWEIDFLFSGSNAKVVPIDSINAPTVGNKTAIFPEILVSRHKVHLERANYSTYLGFGLSASLDYLDFNSNYSATYWPAQQWLAGLNTNVQYRFIRKPNRKARLEYGLSMNLFRFAFKHQRIENPALTVRQQENGNFDMDFLTSSGVFVAFSFGGKDIKASE